MGALKPLSPFSQWHPLPKSDIYVAWPWLTDCIKEMLAETEIKPQLPPVLTWRLKL